MDSSNFRFLNFLSFSTRSLVCPKFVIGLSYRHKQLNMFAFCYSNSTGITTYSIQLESSYGRVSVPVWYLTPGPSESAIRSSDWNNKVAPAQDGAGACATHTQRDSSRRALGTFGPGGSFSRCGPANEFPIHGAIHWGEHHSTPSRHIQTHPLDPWGLTSPEPCCPWKSTEPRSVGPGSAAAVGRAIPLHR